MFENVTLEVSLKPFKKTDETYIRLVCRKIFEDWRPLLKGRKTVSLMLWTSDGSEILDYAGDLDDTFEWCRFLGTANLPMREADEPLETSLHQKKQDYMINAPTMTYRILKTIVTTLKEEGKRAFPDATIRVGETFDIGPEFALSDFKYNRHTEICIGHKLDKKGFVDATATLKGDTYHYAAYPNGIPDGTPFGTFLGKQSEVFLADMGFDYLWLSNGVGFSANPWKRTGVIFDGENYYPEKLEGQKEKVFAFWKLFRKECSFPLETRGTNNSVGIDYASDGVPLWDIYKADLDIVAPPNSPWAALNDNYGLEMMGHMTRICELPNARFPFRYYIHDPWWVNSPWYDRYDGSPCDIYLPMAISRLNREGVVETANTFNILSIDNSWGEMPEACVNEPLPHILRAEKHSADEVAPIVWVYPMHEYTTTKEASTIREMNLGDNFIMDAINDGFPLCCVVSTDNFLAHSTEVYQKSMLLSPVPETDAVCEKLLALAKSGHGVIFYGTKEKLDKIPNFENVKKVDVEGKPSLLRDALADFGYVILFDKKKEEIKVPTIAISRNRNALMFSIYNANTTTKAKFRFPLGAPILCGMEAQMQDGFANYHFSRGEFRECRIFVEQTSGVISCREAPPCNVRFRRSIHLTGLEDASVRLFPEPTCECAVTVGKNADHPPVYHEGFRLMHDEVLGDYLLGEHITGDIYFRIGHKNTR